MICDMRQVTCDSWWEVNLLSKSQLPTCNGLGEIMFEDLEEKGPGLTHLIN